MNAIKLLLFSSLATISLSFMLQIPQNASIIQQMLISQPLNFQQQYFIFPYNIYLYNTNSTQSSSNNLTYIFKKTPLQFFPKSFLGEKQEQQQQMSNQSYLYRQLPEILVLVRQQKQKLLLQPLSASPNNRAFMITSSQLSNQYPKNVSVYTLNLDKCLSEIASKITKPSAGNQKQMLNVLISKINKTSVQSGQNQLIPTNRTQVILPNKMDFSPRKQTSCSNISLIQPAFSATVTSSSDKWQLLHDGLKIMIANVNVQASRFLLTLHTFRKNKLQDITTLNQNLSDLDLQSINYISLCSVQSDSRLLFGDKNRFYLYSVTHPVWRLLNLHQITPGTPSILKVQFGQQCQLLITKERQILNSFIKTEVHFNQSLIRFSQYVGEQRLLIIFDKQYRLYNSTSLQQLKAGDFPKGPFDWKINLRQHYSQNHTLINQYLLSFQDSNQTGPSVLQIFNTTILLLQSHNKIKNNIGNTNNSALKNQSSNMTLKNQNSEQTFSYFFDHAIEPIQFYLNKTAMKIQAMDKAIFQHIQTSYLSNHNYTYASNLPLSYNQFKAQILPEENCSNYTLSGSVIQLQLHSGDWSMCSFDISPQALVLGLIQVRSPIQFKIFVCKSKNTYIGTNEPLSQCQLMLQNNTFTLPKGETQKPLYFYIHPYHLTRFYIFKEPAINVTQTFYLRDIQREQMQFASAVFFSIMLMLTVALFVLICMVLLRPAMRSLLIYYGCLEDNSETTYPLSWFSLKIKIKKLRNNRILNSLRHHIDDTDDQAVCCFCLDKVKQGSKITRAYCTHEFHAECFNDWVRNQPNLRCPTCRRQFTTAGLDHFLASQEHLP